MRVSNINNKTKCIDKKIKFGVNLDIGKFNDLTYELEKVDKKFN